MKTSGWKFSSEYGRVRYVVEHIDYEGDGNGNPTDYFDNRTYRVRWYDTKREAVKYIRELKSQRKGSKWLAHLNLRKVVFSDEKW